jgi:biopolymer transport protein ExbD
MFDFALSGRKRRWSLTPLIDAVFLLLLFFMLTSRFGAEAGLPLEAVGGTYAGPPRLVEVAPESLRLNGVAMAPRELLTELVRISESGADTVVLRPGGGATLQRLVDVMELMKSAGFLNLTIVEEGR